MNCRQRHRRTREHVKKRRSQWPLVALVAMVGGCSAVAGSATGSVEPSRTVTGTAERNRLDLLINEHHRITQAFRQVNATACNRDPHGEPCADWRAFAGALLGYAQRAPRDYYIQGQVVYALVRGGAHDLAATVAESCQAAGWWCGVLRGFALAEGRRLVEAEAAFDAALQVMPERECIIWTDVSLLVSGSAAKALLRSEQCVDRLRHIETFWRLVDPAWSVPGNGRKVEHYSRMTWSTLHDLPLTRDSGGPRTNALSGRSAEHHVLIVRYGMDYYGLLGQWGVYRKTEWPSGLRMSWRCQQVEQRVRWRTMVVSVVSLRPGRHGVQRGSQCQGSYDSDSSVC